MSIKARLKTVEGKLPEARAAAAKKKPSKEELLFMENEEFQRIIAAWTMEVYFEDSEKAAELEKRADYLLETIQPKTKPSDFDEEAYTRLLAEKVVDWMEENGIEPEDIDEERWEVLVNGAENQAE